MRVIALGFFDGVHIGHGALLRRTRERATELGLRAAAMSFDSHPDTLVSGVPVPLINSMDDRAALMRRLYGIDDVIFAHFDRAMMEMPWEDFLGDFLVRQHGAAHLVCGHDFRFGYRGQGTPERLREYCAAHGLGCDVIPEVLLDGRTVSSTYIRTLLTEGQMEEAERYLGHAHVLSGVVRHGFGRGEKIDMQISRFRRACLFRRSASTRRRPRRRAGAGRRASTSASIRRRVRWSGRCSRRGSRGTAATSMGRRSWFSSIRWCAASGNLPRWRH